MEKGKLYGTGTGPGDPGLITLNAIKVIEKCNYIAVPNKIKENSSSYQTVLAALPHIKDKNCICVEMPMVKDKKILGYQTEIISGVPSFCAASALLDRGLVTGSSPLHIIPSAYGIDEALELKGTKVLMKAGSKIPSIKKKLKQKKLSATLVENCGLENEHIYTCIDDIPDNPSYYSLIIITEE